MPWYCITLKGGLISEGISKLVPATSKKWTKSLSSTEKVEDIDYQIWWLGMFFKDEHSDSDWELCDGNYRRP